MIYYGMGCQNDRIFSNIKTLAVPKSSRREGFMEDG